MSSDAKRLPMRGIAAALGVLALVCSACVGETAPPTTDEARATTDEAPATTDEAPATTTDQAPITTPTERIEASSGESQSPVEVLGGKTKTPDETPAEQPPPAAETVAEDSSPKNTFKAVSAGGLHSCAIAADDTVVCWGLNEAGEIDAPAGAYRAISAGAGHSCAIAVDDTVTCWGIDRFGEVDAPAGAYRAISAGESSSCAIAADDTLTCWGSDGFGRFRAPVGAYKAVAVGGGHSCAIAVDDTIICWGYNAFGQVDAPAGAYRAVAVGGGHSCAIAADDTIICWGYNAFGQVDAPAGAYKAVAAGGSHSCAVAADGTVVCWGSNEAGQVDAPSGAYKAVAAGRFHSCAIASDDTLTCWGPVLPPEGVRWVSSRNSEPQPQRSVTVEPASEQPEPVEPASEQPEPVEPAFEQPEPVGPASEQPEPVPERVLEPEAPNLEQPEPGTGGGGGPVRPGEGVDVIAGRANWHHGYFQSALYEQLLEELGYNVTDPAQLEIAPSVAYTAMAIGDMDYWPTSWYPGHYEWHAAELPDGSLVGDHLSVVGEMLFDGVLQGFLVTKSFADAYGVYTMDDLNRNAEVLAAFDATDPVPGNGKADIFGCKQSWTCDDIIENQIAFSGWDNIVQTKGDYDGMFTRAVRRVDKGIPMVIYTWTPSRYITELRPGDSVYWMGVENVLDDSNPTGVPNGEQHSQRGPDGTGGLAAIGPDQCPSAADQPDGRCPIGWLAAHILVTANTEFLEANPAARALFEAVRLTVLEVSRATEMVRTGADPNDLAAQWIADNRDRVDQWLAAARAAEPELDQRELP